MIGRGRDKGESSASGAQSWRELAGPSRRKLNSPLARKRRMQHVIKLLGGVVLVVALICGGYLGIKQLGEREESIQIRPPSKPISKILFDTDGVLPDGWLSSVVDLQPGMSLMDADIHSLKARLEMEGQVESASVERVFPSALRINITERSPVMRLAVAMADGRARQRIVAMDGSVYDGIGYSRAAMNSLPFVQPYQHSNGSYTPMLGIERVGELLNMTRQSQPVLFSTWQVVSLEHYSGDLDMAGQIIEVRSKLVPRILFSASMDFGRQLDRLEYILRYVKQQGNPSMERIDLSLRGSAAVQFSSDRVNIF
ncbi:MAG: cell division protein FtsQ/DivIB [Coraliomargarita sp.]